jgi:hypothetical protein
MAPQKAEAINLRSAGVLEYWSRDKMEHKSVAKGIME